MFHEVRVAGDYMIRHTAIRPGTGNYTAAVYLQVFPQGPDERFLLCIYTGQRNERCIGAG